MCCEAPLRLCDHFQLIGRIDWVPRNELFTLINVNSKSNK